MTGGLVMMSGRYAIKPTLQTDGTSFSAWLSHSSWPMTAMLYAFP